MASNYASSRKGFAFEPLQNNSTDEEWNLVDEIPSHLPSKEAPTSGQRFNFDKGESGLPHYVDYEHASAFDDLSRNIVIIGRKGVGKTTIVNKILQYQESHKGLEAAIRIRKIPISGVLYTIRIIDTDLDRRYTSSVSKERIDRLRATLKDEEISHINLVVFVNAAGRLTGDDKRILMAAISKFRPPQLSQISTLFITHCEPFNNRKREDIVKEFRKDRYTTDMAKLMNKGIITTGFAPLSECDQDTVEYIEAEAQNDVAKIYDIIAGAKVKVHTDELFQQTFWENILRSFHVYACTII